MGAELFGRSGLRKWYNERKKKKRKKVSSNGWYRLGEWMFVEHSAPGIERCCKSSKCYCYGILTQQGRGYQRLSSPSWLALISRNCCWVVIALRHWWWQSSQGTHSACRAAQGTLLVLPRLRLLLGAFGVLTACSQRKAWDGNTELWHLADGGTRARLSLETAALGNNWYKSLQTLKATAPPSHRLFLGPVRQIKWHQN